MKELLKQHQSDLADIRKTQFSYAYKALTDPDINTDEVNRDELVEKILGMDLSRFGMFQQMFKGMGAGSGAEDFLKPKTATPTPTPTETQAPNNYYRGAGRANVGRPMSGQGRNLGRLVAETTAGAAFPGVSAPASTLPANKERFSIGQEYKGYRYIGNNQWKKI